MHSEDHVQLNRDFWGRMDEVIADRNSRLNHEEGEQISLDDYQDIYIQVKGEERERMNFQLTTRNKDGNIADYLETRRPFGAAN